MFTSSFLNKLQFSRIYLTKFILALCFLLLANSSKADIGCRIGNYILTERSDLTFRHGKHNLPIFTFEAGKSHTIRKRDWKKDTNCGIDREVANKYPLAAGYALNPNSRCSPSNNPYDIGRLVVYNPADNTCVNVPLDDYVGFILLTMALVGAYFISKQRGFAFN